MKDFKVGDVVIITQPYQGMELVGASAKIVCINNGDYGLDIDGWDRGHDAGKLPNGSVSGWWVPQRCFKLGKVFKGNK